VRYDHLRREIERLGASLPQLPYLDFADGTRELAAPGESTRSFFGRCIDETCDPERRKRLSTVVGSDMGRLHELIAAVFKPLR